jgi:TonB family protein
MLNHFWRFLPVVALQSAALFGLSAGSNAPIARVQVPREEQEERRLARNVNRDAQFSDVTHAGDLSMCGEAQPPQAVATPNPLVMPVRDRSHVRVSFIIGTDGRVHSPLILESGGSVGDRNVLQAVRIWRFRPATCNGVPTEIEGKIEFSSR